MSSKKDKSSKVSELSLVPPSNESYSPETARGKTPCYSPRQSPSVSDDVNLTPSKKKRGVFKALKSFISKKDKKKGDSTTPEPQSAALDRDASPRNVEERPPVQQVVAIAAGTEVSRSTYFEHHISQDAAESTAPPLAATEEVNAALPDASVIDAGGLHDEPLDNLPEHSAKSLAPITEEEQERETSLGNEIGGEEEPGTIVEADVLDDNTASTPERAETEKLPAEDSPTFSIVQATDVTGSQPSSTKSIGLKDAYQTPPSSPDGSSKAEGHNPSSSMGSQSFNDAQAATETDDKDQPSKDLQVCEVAAQADDAEPRAFAAVSSAIYRTARSFDGEAQFGDLPQEASNQTEEENQISLFVAERSKDDTECFNDVTSSTSSQLGQVAVEDCLSSQPMDVVEEAPETVVGLDSSLCTDPIGVDVSSTGESTSNLASTCPGEAEIDSLPVLADAKAVNDAESLASHLRQSAELAPSADLAHTQIQFSEPQGQALLDVGPSTVGSVAVEELQDIHSNVQDSLSQGVETRVEPVVKEPGMGFAAELNVTPRDVELVQVAEASTAEDPVTAQLQTALKQTAEMQRVIWQSLDFEHSPDAAKWLSQDLDKIQETQPPVVLVVKVFDQASSAIADRGIDNDSMLQTSKEEVFALQQQLERQTEEKEFFRTELQKYKEENAKMREETATQQHILEELTQQMKSQSESLTNNDRDSRSHVSQLIQEREEAVRQQQLVEASRDELARLQGQLKGKIAKLEGIVASSDKRMRQQSQEIEDLKSKCSKLVDELTSARSEMDNTPDRCKILIQQLQEQAELDQQKILDSEARSRKFERLLQHELHEREGLVEYLQLEYETLLTTETELTEQLTQLKSARAEQALSLSHEREKFMETEFFLKQREKELAELRAKHSNGLASFASADKELLELRDLCDRYTRDLEQAAHNVRRAETEVEIISQSNEKMFRYINYIRGRLAANRDAWDSIPELAHLIKELNAWYDREVAERSRATPAAQTRLSSYTTPAAKLKSAVLNN